MKSVFKAYDRMQITVFPVSLGNMISQRLPIRWIAKTVNNFELKMDFFGKNHKLTA